MGGAHRRSITACDHGATDRAGSARLKIDELEAGHVLHEMRREVQGALRRVAKIQPVGARIEIAQDSYRVGGEGICRRIPIERHAHRIEYSETNPRLSLQAQFARQASSLRNPSLDLMTAISSLCIDFGRYHRRASAGSQQSHLGASSPISRLYR